MIFDWLKQIFDNQMRNSSRREVTRFIDGLRSMTDEDMGVVIAVATVIRVNMEKEGFLPDGLFKEPTLPSSAALGRYLMDLNKLVRRFNKMGQPTDGVAALVISYSLRCLNVPDLREYGRDMWEVLSRGFPHVEKALKDGEEAKGEPFPKKVWTEWWTIPLGLDPQETRGET
ncbi:MAG: hypothetical protein P8J29_11695 [Rhodospirillales bacterium]|nr:hypothetical protein [Rhodospirillales bacterium]